SVLAEVLTNVAKHSGAGQAAVTARSRAGRLQLLVTDDGCDGADEDGGSGLTGISRRVAASPRTTVRSPWPARPAAPQPPKWTSPVDRDLRIVIAEDDPLLREGLALLLRAESLDVVATAGTPDGVLDAIDAYQPDVAILDVRMPPTHTDEGIRAAVE